MSPRLVQRNKFIENLKSLLNYARSRGYDVQLGEVFRTYWEAVEYVRLKLGILNSKHRYGIAADVWVLDENGNPVFDFKDGDRWDLIYRDLADYWSKTLGQTAGYYYKSPDKYHFELKENPA